MFWALLFLISAAKLDPTLVSLIREGLEFSYEERYNKADSIFSLVIKRFPSNPAGYFFKGALLDYYMLDFSTDSKEREFYELMKVAIEKSKALKDRNKELEAWACFFEGSAYGYMAMREGRKRQFIKALPHGIKALKLLKRSVSIDPELYDAYLGIGVFEFAMAELPRFIRWITAGNVSREEALKKMELAATKGYFAKELAMDALAWTKSYIGRVREGLDLSCELVEKYKESRSFRWTLAYCQRRAGRWKDALETYKEILELALRDQRDFPYAVGIIIYWIARLYYYEGNWDESLIWIDTGIEIAEKEPDKNRRSSLLEDFKSLQSKVERGIRKIRGPELPDVLRKLKENQ